MHIQQLALVGFRSYLVTDFTFDQPTVVIFGDNAIGKTNILEAMQLLATGESFRASTIDQLIHWQAEVGHVAANITSEHETKELRVVLTHGVVQGKKSHKRKYQVNGVAKRKKDFIGNLLVVSFVPEDLQLITGSPGRRRKQIDTLISQVDPKYTHAIQQYDKSLRQRNKLLQLIQEKKAPENTLEYWDMSLAKHASYIQKCRSRYFELLNQYQVAETALLSHTAIEYKPSICTYEKLQENRKKEILVGYTLRGPHKDDYLFIDTEHDRDLAHYGSRGEQRLAVVWYKLQQLHFIELQTKQRPILLLDDLFSELDQKHTALLISLLGKQQCFITTADKAVAESIATQTTCQHITVR